MGDSRIFVNEAMKKADEMLCGNLKIEPENIDEIVALTASFFHHARNEQREVLLLLCGLALDYSIVKRQTNDFQNMIENYTGMLEAKLAKDKGELQ